MTHTSHTPGPWTAAAEDEFDMWGNYEISHNDTLIAVATHNNPRTPANARLIAEAPAMLALLKDFQAAVNDDPAALPTLAQETEDLITRIEGAE